MKYCISCNTKLPFSAFSPSKVTSDKKRWQCKTCSADEAALERLKKKLNYIAERGSKCTRCGETKHYLLDFHHDPPGTRNECRGVFTRSALNIRKALDPLIMLCSNCHREAHYLTSKQRERLINEEKKQAVMESSERNGAQASTNTWTTHPNVCDGQLRNPAACRPGRRVKGSQSTNHVSP